MESAEDQVSGVVSFTYKFGIKEVLQSSNRSLSL